MGLRPAPSSPNHGRVREPLPDAYGRITNPRRFATLIASTEELLDRLERLYQVERHAGHNLDPDLVASIPGGATRVVRIAPARGGGAPLVVAFTDFPGVRVRFGRWHIEAFPVCGCDACDEQPGELADDLAAKVDALGAGRFSEQLSLFRRPGLSYSFGDGSGWSRSARREVLSLGRPQRLRWDAWPRGA